MATVMTVREQWVGLVTLWPPSCFTNGACLRFGRSIERLRGGCFLCCPSLGTSGGEGWDCHFRLLRYPPLFCQSSLPACRPGQHFASSRLRYAPVSRASLSLSVLRAPCRVKLDDCLVQHGGVLQRSRAIG